MTKLSDNLTPSLLLVEQDDTAVVAPAAGNQRLFIDEADGLLYLKDSADDVTAVGGAGGGDITTDAAWAAKGDLIVGTANDTAAILTAGTNDYVLTAASGEATGLKWAAAAGGGGGALVLLEQHTASSSATLDFTTAISATYDEYMIELVDVLAATDGADFLMRVSTDGGANYDAGANYNWADAFAYPGSGGGEGATGATSIKLSGTVKNASMGVTGSLRLMNVAGSGWKSVVGQVTNLHNSVGIITRSVTGAYTAATAVNAFRFLFSAGNIASGTIRVYGVAKA